MKQILARSFVALCVFHAAAIHAATTRYWDINGATAGAGGTSPGGAWTGSFWSTDPNGEAATGTFASGDFAVFSAGADATGSFTVSGNATAGSITIEEGRVVVSGNITLGAGSITINAGGTLSINNSARIGASTGSVIYLNGGKMEDTNSGANGSFVDTDQTIVLNGGGTIAHTRAGVQNILDVNTVISGTGPLTNAGAGTLAIASKSTYSGATYITAGVLRLRSNNNRLPTGTALTITSPGTLDIDGLAQQVASLSGDGTVVLDGTYGSGELIVGGNSTTAEPFSGVISDTSGYASIVTKRGSGTLILSGPNTYAGPTVIERGRLSVSSLNRVSNGSASSSLGAPSSAANGTLSFGADDYTGTLIYTGAGEDTDRIIDLIGTTGGATIQNDGSGPINFTSNCKATGDGDKTLKLQGSNNGANKIAKIVDSSPGATALVKAGTGTWILAKANTYTGGTTVSDGLLEASVAGTIPGNASVTAGTLRLSSASAMASSAILTLAEAPAAGAVDLNFAGTQVVAGLYFGAVAQASGTWGPVGSGAGHEDAAFTGTGLLRINSAPVAPAAKTQSTPKDTPSTFANVKLLQGATDADGDPLTISAVSAASAQGGTVALQADDVLYTPPAGYTGPDSYTYTISDGYVTVPGTVNVTVTGNGGGSPNVVSPPAYADGRVSVTFAGIPGVEYTVEYAEGAPGPSWTRLGSFTAGANGLFIVEDPAAESPSRYYRAVHPAY